MKENTADNVGKERADGSCKTAVDPKTILSLLKSMASCLKAARLYSSSHPVFLKSVESLTSELSAILDSEESIKIFVEKERFKYKKWLLGKGNINVISFSNHLRSVGIKSISFESGLDEQEIAALFDSVNTDPDQIDYEGGIDSLMVSHGADHIVVEELTTKKAGDEGTVVQEAETARKESMLERLKQIEEGSKESADEVFDLLKDPDPLSREALQIVRKSRFRKGKQTVPADEVYKFYKTIEAALADIQHQDRRPYYNAMAETLLHLDQDVRNQILLKHLIPNLKEQLLAKSIMKEFKPSEMADLLADFFPIIPEIIPRTMGLLSILGYTTTDAKTILPRLKRKLIENGKIDPILISRLDGKKGLPETGAAGIMLPSLPTLSELANMLGEYTEEESQIIGEIVSLDLEDYGIRESTPALLHLLRNQKQPRSVDVILEVLENNFRISIASLKLDNVINLIIELKDLKESAEPYMVPLRERLDGLISKIIDPSVLEEILSEIAKFDTVSDDVTVKFKTLVQMFGEDSVASLLEVLSSTEDIAIRKFLTDTLSEMGNDYLFLIGSRIDDKRWYFVRNIVSILGRLRNEAVIPYLTRTLNHENDKVRYETIRALGMLGTQRCLELIAKSLDSPDIETKVLSIRWLARHNAISAVRRIIETAESADNSAEGLNLKKEAAEALGALGTLDSVSLLQKWYSEKKLFGKSQHEDLRQASLRSLEIIQKKFPHQRIVPQ